MPPVWPVPRSLKQKSINRKMNPVTVTDDGGPVEKGLHIYRAP